MSRKQPMTQTVLRNGVQFPRYLTSPPAPGHRWQIADLATGAHFGDYPNKQLALAAARNLNRTPEGGD